jgi:hypothetical protein
MAQDPGLPSSPAVPARRAATQRRGAPASAPCAPKYMRAIPASAAARSQFRHGREVEYITQPDGIRLNLQFGEIDRAQHLLVEAGAGSEIAYGDGDVVDHVAGAPALTSL